jgi:hypothetical protein
LVRYVVALVMNCARLLDHLVPAARLIALRMRQ